MAAVARAYLGPTVPRERLVVVAGEDDLATAHACRHLQTAAAALDLSSVLVQRHKETVDLELAADANPQLVIYDEGATDEGQARSLSAARSAQGADLLLWCPRPGRGPRWIYLLSLWVWSLQPQQVRCVVDRASLGGMEFSSLRYRLRKGLRRTEVGEGAELLLSPEIAHGEASIMFYQQILQSLLSAAPGRSAKSKLLELRRATAILAFLLMSCGWFAGALAQSSSTALVEVINFSKARTTQVGGGAKPALYHGPAFSLRLQPGVGAWSGDGQTLTLTSERRDTIFELDGVPVEWASGTHRIGESFVIQCAEYSGVFERGRVDMLPDRVVVHAVVGGNPLSSKGGVFVSLLLAAVIFFLLWRANSLQKRLDKPRMSMRHPH